MRYLLFFVLTIFISGCHTDNSSNDTKDDKKLEYVFVGRKRHSIDTIYRSLVNKEYSDSIFRLSYLRFKSKDTLIEKFELPISTSLKTFSHLNDTSDYRLVLLDRKLIKYESKEFYVYKYLFDDIDADDEEMLYFFVPEFGIIINKSAWWGNYDRLINNGKKEYKDDLFYVSEMIIFDSDFFHKQ